jgi:hypothetical protein
MLDDMKAIDDDFCIRKALLDELNVRLIHVDHNATHPLSDLKVIAMEVANE